MTSFPEPHADTPLLPISSPEQSGPEPERDDPASAGSSGSSVVGFGSGVLRAFAGLALVAMVVAWGLAPALPGSASGISGWIWASGIASMLLSQLLVVTGALVVFRLILRTLRQGELGVVYRLVAIPLSAGALTIIMASAQAPERPGTALGLAVITSIVAIAATFPTLSAPHTRAAGFMLGIVGAASFIHVLARVLAIHASDHAAISLFTAAQSVATLSFVLDVTSIALVAIWLGAHNWSRTTVSAVVLVGVSALVAWGAVHGSSYDAPLWQVLASRALAGMTRHPAPLVLPLLRYLVEVLALLTAAVVLLVPRRRSVVQALLALALLARTSTDIPLCALCLEAAALLGPLASLAEQHVTGSADPAGPAVCRMAPEPGNSSTHLNR